MTEVALRCPACEYEIKDESFVYCPMCGSRFDGKSKETGVYYLEKIKYLWERQEGGGLLYKNFKSVRQSGIFPYKKVKPIRTELGDFSHIHLFNLRTYSFLYFSPQSVRDMYLMGKLIGCYTAESALKTLRLESLASSLQKTGLFWKIFENRKVKEAIRTGWIATGGGLLDVTKTNAKKRDVYFDLRDTALSVLPGMSEPNCSIASSIFCGHAEALFDGFWDKVEIKCERDGESCCEFRMYLHEKEEEPVVYVPQKDEVEVVLDKIVDDLRSRKRLRKELDDFLYIITPQCYNYFLLSMSHGHEILSKHSGVISGERIASNAGLDDSDATFAYARDLFSYLKAGILHEPIEQGDRLLLRMDESVYASGVSNIGLKLDVFLAGIIEGALRQATGEKWQVDETKCLANGDDFCEFSCNKV